MNADTRAEFAPSPRAELYYQTRLVFIERDTAAALACYRRILSSTRTYLRGSQRTQRWLFTPSRPPLCGEDSL